jgi:general secretion pathway protein D
VLIYPGTVAKLKEYQELSVRTFQLVNTDVKAVAANIKALLKGRDVVADDKLNMLIARDTPDALRVIEKLVALHDVAEPEVMLEVEILEVSRTKLSELGVRWPDSLSLTPLASNAAVGLTLQDLRDLNSTTIGASLGGIKLNLKSENTGVNILANPKIRVTNREKAKVLIGDRVPVVTVTTSPTGGYAESVSYLDVGLKLDVEPVIYRGNDIVIKIALEVSNLVDTKVTKAGGVAYTLGTRNANTTLRLRDGENQILAGLINDEDRKSANKLPGLGDMPAVGRLFGSAVDDGKKSEIMLSITPRLIRNVYRPDAGVLEFSSGTEGSLRERPPVKVSKPAVAPVVTVTPAAAMAGKSNQILIAE